MNLDRRIYRHIMLGHNIVGCRLDAMIRSPRPPSSLISHPVSSLILPLPEFPFDRPLDRLGAVSKAEPLRALSTVERLSSRFRLAVHPFTWKLDVEGMLPKPPNWENVILSNAKNHVRAQTRPFAALRVTRQPFGQHALKT
jgi:hypothetical protein